VDKDTGEEVQVGFQTSKDLLDTPSDSSWKIRTRLGKVGELINDF
jgi:hypothetical protein